MPFVVRYVSNTPRSDLNSSIMTGSRRVIDHTTFSEFQWSRDSKTPAMFELPSGFKVLRFELGDEFLEVIRDLYALRCIRDADLPIPKDSISVMRIDNHQASIQSRLFSLPRNSEVASCCFIGAYMCSTTLRCISWHNPTIPVSTSLRFQYFFVVCIE